MAIPYLGGPRSLSCDGRGLICRAWGYFLILQGGRAQRCLTGCVSVAETLPRVLYVVKQDTKLDRCRFCSLTSQMWFWFVEMLEVILAWVLAWVPSLPFPVGATVQSCASNGNYAREACQGFSRSSFAQRFRGGCEIFVSPKSEYLRREMSDTDEAVWTTTWTDESIKDYWKHLNLFLLLLAFWIT